MHRACEYNENLANNHYVCGKALGTRMKLYMSASGREYNRSNFSGLRRDEFSNQFNIRSDTDTNISSLVFIYHEWIAVKLFQVEPAMKQ